MAEYYGLPLSAHAKIFLSFDIVSRDEINFDHINNQKEIGEIFLNNVAKTIKYTDFCKLRSLYLDFGRYNNVSNEFPEYLAQHLSTDIEGLFDYFVRDLYGSFIAPSDVWLECMFKLIPKANLNIPTKTFLMAMRRANVNGYHTKVDVLEKHYGQLPNFRAAKLVYGLGS